MFGEFVELKRIDRHLRDLSEQAKDLTGVDREFRMDMINVWLDARNRVTKP